MKCPHCMVEYHDVVQLFPIGADDEGNYEVSLRCCPKCQRNSYALITYVQEYKSVSGSAQNFKTIISERMIRPRVANRSPAPAEVPRQYATDYLEACLVISDSPKASAALSRRCLQNIIRGHLGIKKKELSSEIQEVIDNKYFFPSDILESIAAVRTVGNYAAHPVKSYSAGEIHGVEPNEAEWNLDVLEMIFDYLFVGPAAVKKKRDALNAKLKGGGNSRPE